MKGMRGGAGGRPRPSAQKIVTTAGNGYWAYGKVWAIRTARNGSVQPGRDSDSSGLVWLRPANGLIPCPNPGANAPGAPTIGVVCEKPGTYAEPSGTDPRPG